MVRNFLPRVFISWKKQKLLFCLSASTFCFYVIVFTTTLQDKFKESMNEDKMKLGISTDLLTTGIM